MGRTKWIVAAMTIVVVASSFVARATVAEARERTHIERLLPRRDGMVKFGYTYNSDVDVRNSPGSFAYHMIRFQGHAPIPIGDNVVFAPGVLYDLHHFRLHNTINYLNQNTLNVHDVGPTFNALIGFGEDWLLDLNFTPLISSDLKGFGWNDVQFMGYALAGWAFSDHASFLFGVAVNKEFWRYLPIPVIGFVVRPEGSFFSFEALLPRYLRADFKIASFWKLFVQGEFEGDVWYVRGDGSVPNHFGKFMETHVGAGARFTFVRGFDVEVWGGANPFRRIQFKDNTGSIIKRRVDIGYFGQLNLIITPDLFRQSR